MQDFCDGSVATGTAVVFDVAPSDAAVASSGFLCRPSVKCRAHFPGQLANGLARSAVDGRPARLGVCVAPPRYTRGTDRVIIRRRRTIIRHVAFVVAIVFGARARNGYRHRTNIFLLLPPPSSTKVIRHAPPRRPGLVITYYTFYYFVVFFFFFCFIFGSAAVFTFCFPGRICIVVSGQFVFVSHVFVPVRLHQKPARHVDVCRNIAINCGIDFGLVKRSGLPPDSEPKQIY